MVRLIVKELTLNFHPFSNLRDVLEEAVNATALNPRYKELFGVLCDPQQNEQLGE